MSSIGDFLNAKDDDEESSLWNSSLPSPSASFRVNEEKLQKILLLKKRIIKLRKNAKREQKERRWEKLEENIRKIQGLLDFLIIRVEDFREKSLLFLRSPDEMR